MTAATTPTPPNRPGTRLRLSPAGTVGQESLGNIAFSASLKVGEARTGGWAIHATHHIEQRRLAAA